MTSLVLQLWQTSTASPQLAATPFMLAASAARHQAVAPLNRPLSAYIEDATRSGARVHLCSTAMRDRGLDPEAMIEGCQSVLGMVSMLERLTQADTTVLTY